MTSDSTTGCPIEPVHRRLADAHELWHRASRDYFEPRAFRISVNACIETLRTVTFILQKNRSTIPNFEGWYSKWQTILAGDKLCSWAKDARNHVEKRGDLETLSTMRVALIDSHFDRPFLEFEVDPMTTTEDVATIVRAKTFPEGVRRDGALRIERRWVATTLPTHELLEALTHVYSILERMLRDAHRQLGIYEPDEDSFQERPPCMIWASEQRAYTCSLATGEPLTVEKQVHEVTDELNAVARERYGSGLPKIDAQSLRELSERDRAERYLQYAQTVMKRDGFHEPIVILDSPGGSEVFTYRDTGRPEKYLFSRQLALEVERTRATSVTVIAEAWMAPVAESGPRINAAEAHSREEVLVVAVATASGGQSILFSRFTRDDGSITFEDAAECDFDPFVGLLAPVRNVWGKAAL